MTNRNNKKKNPQKSVPVTINKVLLLPSLPAESKEINVLSKYFQPKKLWLKTNLKPPMINLANHMHRHLNLQLTHLKF